MINEIAGRANVIGYRSMRRPVDKKSNVIDVHLLDWLNRFTHHHQRFAQSHAPVNGSHDADRLLPQRPGPLRPASVYGRVTKQMHPPLGPQCHPTQLAHVNDSAFFFCFVFLFFFVALYVAVSTPQKSEKGLAQLKAKSLLPVVKVDAFLADCLFIIW